MLLSAAVLAGVAAPAAARKAKTSPETLLRVSTPVSRRTVPAHPFINVVVRFDTANGADPATFRAHLGGVNVTSRFEPIVVNGAVVGGRAKLEPTLLHVGRRYNHLRLTMRGRGSNGAHLHDVDRVRFRATEAPDGAPVANALAESDIIVSGVPLQFDGTQSSDPESDLLTYQWDFGDGTTSTDPRPLHTFASNAIDVTVHLTVSDGQLASTAQLTMLAVPPLDPGRTPGTLKVDAPSALEFGAVPLGAGATRAFTVQNTDATATSQLKVRLGACDYTWPTGQCEGGGAFALDASDLDLGPGESASVNLTFTPGSSGHQSAQLTVVASASNANAVHLLSHAYGGVAPGTGPLPISETLFFAGTTTDIEGILPSGERIVPDDTVRACLVPQNGNGSGDYCLVDADCASNGGTCPAVGTCIGGARAAQSCAMPADCPGGFCSNDSAFLPLDMAGDGAGGLYLLSDDGSYSDPNPNPVTELDGTLLHLGMDANGTRTAANIVTRTPTCTMQIASDAVPPGAGGELYVAWYQSVNTNCFRSALEQLVAIRKSDGTQTVLLPRIDAAEGLDPCNDDYDPADDLEAARDGSAIFVALPGGIYRLRPSMLLITPDADPNVFRVHPDGSVLLVTTEDKGPTGLVHVYKISPDQAVNGAPHLSDLMPCATVEIPNNRAATGPALLTDYIYLAITPATPGSLDGTIVVSFITTGGIGVLPSNLRVGGTLAISSPAGTDVCSVIGLVNLEPLDQLTF
jgi:PKD repeat protein